MPTTAKPAGTVCSGINGVSYAPPSTVLSVFAKGRGSAKTASRPFRFRKSAPIPEKRRPSLLRNRPSCLPVRQGSRRRSRSGASPFDACLLYTSPCNLPDSVCVTRVSYHIRAGLSRKRAQSARRRAGFFIFFARGLDIRAPRCYIGENS